MKKIRSCAILLAAVLLTSCNNLENLYIFWFQLNSGSGKYELFKPFAWIKAGGSGLSGSGIASISLNADRGNLTATDNTRVADITVDSYITTDSVAIFDASMANGDPVTNATDIISWATSVKENGPSDQIPDVYQPGGAQDSDAERYHLTPHVFYLFPTVLRASSSKTMLPASTS